MKIPSLYTEQPLPQITSANKPVDQELAGHQKSSVHKAKTIFSAKTAVLNMLNKIKTLSINIVKNCLPSSSDERQSNKVSSKKPALSNNTETKLSSSNHASLPKTGGLDEIITSESEKKQQEEELLDLFKEKLPRTIYRTQKYNNLSSLWKRKKPPTLSDSSLGQNTGKKQRLVLQTTSSS
ncbi:MAG: hypothetical protein AAGI90_07180 [Chlamydiota bacterium]